MNSFLTKIIGDKKEWKAMQVLALFETNAAQDTTALDVADLLAQ